MTLEAAPPGYPTLRRAEYSDPGNNSCPPVEKIAVALGVPAASVRTRYFRAKGLLREALTREIDAASGDAFAFAGGRCDRFVAGVFERLKALQPGDA